MRKKSSLQALPRFKVLRSLRTSAFVRLCRLEWPALLWGQLGWGIAIQQGGSHQRAGKKNRGIDENAASSPEELKSDQPSWNQKRTRKAKQPSQKLEEWKTCLFPGLQGSLALDSCPGPWNRNPRSQNQNSRQDP